MSLNYTCRLCKSEDEVSQKVKVPGSVRSLKVEEYNVWRCKRCDSLNALESVDFGTIYLKYPMKKQKLVFFTNIIFENRLMLLSTLGLKKEHKILDYGCGNGLFVIFLRNKGFKCDGFDLYNSEFSDDLVLAKKYDFILSQDVFEHIENPEELLLALKNNLLKDGRLVIGTPFSDNVDIFDEVDQIGILHQPFHRGIISKKQIPSFFKLYGLIVEKVITKSYIDTWFPFVNSQFLFRLFKSGGGIMDVGFEPISLVHWLKNPGLIFWGLCGGFFTRNQNLVIVARVSDH